MRFVDEHRDRYAVALLLRVLEIEPSTYYGWVARSDAPCERVEVDFHRANQESFKYVADRVRRLDAPPEGRTDDAA